MDISVIVCTHNPRQDYLQRTLDGLRAQSLPRDNWELLVVDNDSSEAVGEPDARVITEPKLGLAHARITGIKAAKGSLIVFVDDDNVLAPDYLENALRILGEMPMLGTMGAGQIVPEFEISPPEHLKPWLGWLALKALDAPKWSNIMREYAALPVGAGLCVRSNIAHKYVEQYERAGFTVGGRRGRNDLSGGEDFEMSFVACLLGFGMSVWPELKMVHLIPKNRLTEDYISRVVAGSKASVALLEYKWFSKKWRAPFWPHIVYHHLMAMRRLKGIDRKIEAAWMRARYRVWWTIFRSKFS